MITMSFGLTATFPGQTEGKSWDASWAVLSDDIVWVNTLLPVANAPAPSINTNVGFIDIPADYTPGPHETTIMSVRFGGPDGVFVPVTVDSFLGGPAASPADSAQVITLNAPWDSLKDIKVSTISATTLGVVGFVDAWITAPLDNNDHIVWLDQVKRAAVALGDGNDRVVVNVVSNEDKWSNQFDINVGDGNDTVLVRPEPNDELARMSAPAGYTFNSNPQLSTADITVGNGNDAISVDEISANIHVGSGNDTINIIDGNSTTWLGAGRSTMRIAAANGTNPGYWRLDTQRPSSTVNFGSGHADVTIDDTSWTMTPRVTLNFMHGKTGGSTLATADVIRYDHFDAGSHTMGNHQWDPGHYVWGDLADLTINLAGYHAGSWATLTAAPAGSPMLLQLHDGATGSIDAVVLYGSAARGVASLHLHFT